MISLIIQVITKKEMKTKTNKLHRNFAKDNNSFRINPKQVNIAIKWENSQLAFNEPSEPVTPDVGIISAYNHKISNHSLSGPVYLTDNFTFLQTEPCDEYNFSDDPDTLALVEGYQCLSNSTDFFLGGNSFSQNFSSLEIVLQSWIGAIGWKTPIEVYNKLFLSTVRVVILSSYLDYDNIEQPITKFYNFKQQTFNYDVSYPMVPW